MIRSFVGKGCSIQARYPLETFQIFTNIKKKTAPFTSRGLVPEYTCLLIRVNEAIRFVMAAKGHIRFIVEWFQLIRGTSSVCTHARTQRVRGAFAVGHCSSRIWFPAETQHWSFSEGSCFSIVSGGVSFRLFQQLANRCTSDICRSRFDHQGAYRAGFSGYTTQSCGGYSALNHRGRQCSPKHWSRLARDSCAEREKRQ